ncbi:hypothetical protein HY418_03590 [Candidatus Kaiserbacteria bacterium]|nr:hypothetical protein [Candidatus Kaiserbacteria bacterium]
MSDTEPTFAAAQGVVLELPKLKIVHISNTASNLPGEKLNQHCERLAEQLSEHLGKPWVVLADEALFDDAATLFEKRGVRVERGELTDAIEDRWAHDAKLQEAAVA